MNSVIESAHRAYQRRDWRAAVDGLELARAGGDLSADDLFALANAAWWLGEVDRSVAAGEEAFRRFLQADRTTMAAMSAMWVGMNLLLRGDDTLGSGWMGRAVRLVEDRPDTVEHHYLRYITVVESRIETAGGRVLTPRTEIGPGMGAFAAFADPAGVEFGLYEEPRR